jgi:hypothetical protein
VLPASADAIAGRIPDDAVVLDIGGWGRPFRRADWVLDQMPYETRGQYGYDGAGPERFSRETWIQRDICDRTPFPFADKAVDFAVCSQTLEDVRDPVWVCAEINRIAKAGYLETPSRLEEQTYGIQGAWVGWGHHHWLVEMADGRVEFVFKHHVLHGRASDHFPAGYVDQVNPAERVTTLWWEGSFSYRERTFDRPEELDDYLASFVRAQLARRPAAEPAARQPVWRRVTSRRHSFAP